jgi:hypothetical protein
MLLPQKTMVQCMAPPLLLCVPPYILTTGALLLHMGKWSNLSDCLVCKRCRNLYYHVSFF